MSPPSPPSPPTAELEELVVSEAGPTRRSRPSSDMPTTRSQTRSLTQSIRPYDLSKVTNQGFKDLLLRVCGEETDADVASCEEGSKQWTFTFMDGSTVSVPSSQEDDESPKCSCQAQDAGVMACKHILWLIHEVQLVAGPPGQIRLREDGSTTPPLSTMIAKCQVQGFDALVSKQLWIETQPVDEAERRVFEELLSVFEPNHYTADESRYSNWTPYAGSKSHWFEVERSQRYKNFSEWLIQRIFSLKSETMTLQLSSIVKPEFQQQTLFHKLYCRAKRTLDFVDLYRVDPASPALDVIKGAEHLQVIVRKFRTELERLRDNARARSFAVKPLVQILAAVVLQWDVDLYSNVVWQRNGSADGGNLYLHLFLDNGNGPFILNVIDELIDREAMRIAVAKENSSLTAPMTQLCKKLGVDGRVPQKAREMAGRTAQRMAL